MLFNSSEFFFFFVVVTTLYFVLPHRFRWAFLLAASCFFYMFFKPVYILILAFTIAIDYAAGIYIEQANTTQKRKLFLIISLVANIGVLAIFKYYNFLNDNITSLADYWGFENHIPYLHILLPIGLSFHTFQAMSYTLEVYYGRQKAERHVGIYALYVMFYPQLVAGPIERPQNIIYQFREKHFFSFENAVTGLNLIALGLFKKIVVADRLAIYVNQVYSDLGNANTLSTLLAVCFFSLQIYGDFSGYSDIARGTAKVMGFDLLLNFNRPYAAQSLAEFWKRWHMSLSTWFRDYVYIPLGGNRVRQWKWYRNLAVVFLLSGLWHGANWTFIVWGALHGAYLIFAIATADVRKNFHPHSPKLAKGLNQITVFALVTFAWIFFRSTHMAQAQQVIHNLLSVDFSWNATQLFAGKGPLNFALTFVSLLLFAIVRLPKANASSSQHVAFLLFLAFLILLIGQHQASEFIYFQF